MTRSAPIFLALLLCAVATDARAQGEAAQPGEEQLAARKAYDALVQSVQADIADLSPGTKAPDGALYKAIRSAEEEMLRRAQVSAAVDEGDVRKSRVYDRLGDAERLDMELRWATERFQTKLDEYRQLAGDVFASYVEYEERAHAALVKLDEAASKSAVFRGSGAESIEMPAKAVPEAELDGMRTALRKLLADRKGPQDAQPGTGALLGWSGKLRLLRGELDIREDLREQLELELEALKQSLAGEASSTKPPAADAGTKDAAPQVPEEYERLADRIDRLEGEISDAHSRAERAAAQRQTAQGIVDDKLKNENEVEQSLKDTREQTAAVEGTSPMRELHAFTLRELEDAIEQRLAAARLDTRREQTRLEILDRGVKALKARALLIQDDELPAAREAYWRSWGVTAAWRAGRVAVVFVLAWLLLFVIRRVGARILARIVLKEQSQAGDDAHHRQRTRTLFAVVITTMRVIVWVLAVMFALSQFDIDYGPLLVAAGGVSLAVGFGAQSLVKDFFAGFFILLEGQFSIGDVIEINGKQGTVENLNLRTTVIRSLDGTVHTIPNGQISLTSNMTKLWSRAVLEIGVAYEENADDVMALLEAVGREMKQDQVWGGKLQELIMQGVESFGDNSVNVRLLLKTRPGEQWGAAREFRRRVKQKFDEFGVEIPWPQRVISNKAEPTAGMARTERAKLLRYVRTMRGEKVDQAEAAISVEERDRAASKAQESQRMAREEARPAEGGKAEPTPEEPRPPLNAAEKTERDLAERKSQDKVDP